MMHFDDGINGVRTVTSISDKAVLYGLIGATGLIAIVLIGAFIILPALTPKSLPDLGVAPDFTLVDQDRNNVSLSDFRGKIVILGFMYTHCPDAQFCILLNGVFAELQNRLGDRLGKDVIFLSISFDWQYDTPEKLKKFGESYNANFNGWKFLTALDNNTMQSVMASYGLVAYVSGYMNMTVTDPETGQNKTMQMPMYAHNFVTSLIDQKGHIRQWYTNFETTLDPYKDGYSQWKASTVEEHVNMLLSEQST